jgi:hypothetical protein
MVDALVVDEAIGIVHPVLRRCKVILRTIGLIVTLSRSEA